MVIGNIVDDAVEAIFGRDVMRMGNRKRAHWLKSALIYWRERGFPHIRLTKSEILAQFQQLCHSPQSVLVDGAAIGASTLGLRLANYYHPQMWHARSHGHLKSPYDHFHEDERLLTMLERAPKFWPNARCWSAQAVRNLVRIYSGGRVANFRPVVARQVINTFSRDGDVIVDFSAGYGGRLLAALTLNRVYIGIDPARRQITGLSRMHRDLRLEKKCKVHLIEGCAEDELPSMEPRSTDIVFSSPPYFNLEIYSNERSQSSNRYKEYGQWKEEFLDVVIRHSRRVLRRNGIFAINISSGSESPLEKDAVAIVSRMFAYHRTHYVKMPARPFQRAQNGGVYRNEPIYVFKKR